jgi:phenylalanyl-tRNA synthetase beta chain
VLRTTLLPSLIEAARRNIEAGSRDIALFEIARVYRPGNGALPDERIHVGAIVEGGFSRVKGVVETLARALHAELAFSADQHPLLHPGKAARVEAGVLGELHPSVLEGEWSVFELDLEQLLEAGRGPVRYEDVISYPALNQDLAFAVPEDVPAAALVDAAREAAGPELRDARIFDVYRGGQVGEGRKSIAMHVTFQSQERTLTDEDAAALRERIVEALGSRFGAELRA